MAFSQGYTHLDPRRRSGPGRFGGPRLLWFRRLDMLAHLTRHRPMKLASLILTCLIATPAARAQQRERARDLGVPLEGTPGPLDAITDVGGVEVGHATIISGSGKLVVGRGPVRTGVTAI